MDLRKLKEDTIKGVIWTSFDRIGYQVVRVIIAIILARLLSPADYGLIGMVTIFITFSSLISESGLGTALIKKKDAGNKDYTSAFIYNASISTVAYVVIYFCSGWIASFYGVPQLKEITQVLSLAIIINALCSVQNTILIKELKFKYLTIINFLSIFISGTAAITMALMGWGVWSLVYQVLIMALVRLIVHFYLGKWLPAVKDYSSKSFKELYGFGSKLLATAFTGQLSRNSINVIIGKVYSSTQLGFFTQAKSLMEIPSVNISYVFENVTFPVLSKLQDDEEKLKKGYIRMMEAMAFVLFPVMLFLSTMSYPIIKVMLGDKWISSAPLLMWLALFGLFNPLNAVNVNILKIKNKMNTYMKLGFINQAVLVVLIIASAPISVYFMSVVYGLYGIYIFLINSHFCGKFINYSLTKHLKDLFFIAAAAVVMCFSVWAFGVLIGKVNVLMLILEVILGSAVYMGIMYLFKKELLAEFRSYLKFNKTTI